MKSVAACCLLAWAAVGLVSNSAIAAMPLQVIEPNTGKLLAGAGIEVLTTDGKPVMTTHATTGVFGKGVDVEAARTVDPQLGTVVLRAVERGIPGSMRVRYQPEPSFWAQVWDAPRRAWRPGHDRGDWRPEVVYRYDEQPHVFVSLEYDVYRAALGVLEGQRVRTLESLFAREAGALLGAAVVNGVVDAGERAALEKPLGALLEAEVKRPNDALNRQLSEAIRSLLKKRLPGAHARVVDLLVRPFDPGFRRQMVDAVRSAPEAAGAVTIASPALREQAKQDEQRLAQIQQHLAKLQDVVDGSVRKAAAPQDLRELEQFMADLLAFLETVQQKTGRAPLDAELRRRLERVQRIVGGAVGQRLQAVLRAPQDPDLLKRLEVDLEAAISRESCTRIDEILIRITPGAVQVLAKDAAGQQELLRILEDLSKLLAQVHEMGLEPPLSDAARDLVLMLARQPAVPPALAGELARVTRLDPLVSLLFDLGGRLEDLILAERTKAPIPPMIAVPMSKPWVTPVVTGIPLGCPQCAAVE